MPFDKPNGTLNLLSELMAGYHSRNISNELPDHVNTFYDILRQAISDGAESPGSGSHGNGGVVVTNISGRGYNHIHASTTGEEYAIGGSYTDKTIGGVFDSNHTAYYYNAEDIDQLKRPWVNVGYFIPLVMVYAFIFITGILGNSLVIAVLCLGRAGRCVTFPCLISMACADNVFVLVCVPYAVITHFFSHWSSTSFLCKLSGFVEHLTANATVLSLILISVERYLVIAHPISAKRYCTSKTTRIALVCTWVAAIIMAGPAFAVMGTESATFYNNASSVVVVLCADYSVSSDGRVAYAVWMLISLFLLPTAILVFCYVKCIHVLWSSRRQLETMTPNNSNRSPLPHPRGGHEHTQVELRYGSTLTAQTVLKSSPSLRAGEKALQARKQVIKMLIIIIVVFFIAWGPKLIITVLKKYQVSFLYFRSAFIMERIFQMLPYLQSCINPVIYVFMSRNIRTSIHRIACACQRCRKRHGLEESPSHEMLPTKHSQVEADTSSNNKSFCVGGTRGGRAYL